MAKKSTWQPTEEELAALDARHERRNQLCRRLCDLMGWQQKTGHIWGHLRKVALAEAAVIGLDKLEEIIRRLEGA